MHHFTLPHEHSSGTLLALTGATHQDKFAWCSNSSGLLHSLHSCPPELLPWSLQASGL